MHRSSAVPRRDQPRGGDQQVEEAVVGEAGLRVGVPDRVVQARGRLERRVAGVDHATGTRRPRRCSGSSAASPPERIFGPAAVLDHPRMPSSQPRQPRRGSITRIDVLGTNSDTRSSHTSSTSDGAGISTMRSASSLDPRLDDRQRLRHPAQPGVDDQRQRHRSRRLHLDQVGDQLAAAGRPGSRNRPTRSAYRPSGAAAVHARPRRPCGVARREHGGVVDEASEQRRDIRLTRDTGTECGA